MTGAVGSRDNRGPRAETGLLSTFLRLICCYNACCLGIHESRDSRICCYNACVTKTKLKTIPQTAELVSTNQLVLVVFLVLEVVTILPSTSYR